ncbi:tRNA-(ms[2]io[6]A)-hydroxylase [Psychrobacter sp.]|uniref:tRNA-(ms[2]io[6]A)-hydroxylase n=1 Tax=Psychrobacter sp. TaxID=56811 RepID=UPI0025DE47BD|nr:tRNA-(ms[2]io[6]A)-hydroxylase [Psychrobacter sp.]
MNDNLLNDSNNTVTSPTKTDISHIYEFLSVPTPKAWLDQAVNNLPLLIQDHANCEKKAAGTAMNLIFRYEFHQDLQLKLAQLIREEMLHYEQVVGIMEECGQKWQHLTASRYAKGMLQHKRTYEPAAMIDILIIGAFIEARSCERFAALSEVIDDERLARYYRYLLKSESRHYEDYLTLARSLEPNQTLDVDIDTLFKTKNSSINKDEETINIDERIEFFRQIEAELITSPDKELRFHSGVPEAM